MHIEALLPLFREELRQRMAVWPASDLEEFRQDCMTILAEAGDCILYGGYKPGKSNAACIPKYQEAIRRWGLRTPTNALIYVVAFLLEHNARNGFGPVELFGHTFKPEDAAGVRGAGGVGCRGAVK